MPLYLPAPAHDPRGPDGRGWNRLRVESIVGDQCALLPHSYAALYEAQDTRRAAWGPFGPCHRAGACTGCPRFTQLRETRTLIAFPGPRVLVRLAGDGPIPQPHVMTDPDPAAGWASASTPMAWNELVRLAGWKLGRQHHDEHSAGFWLEREPDDRHAPEV